ncbi:hypothetical protein RYX36_011428 [Vicia faba]
MKTEPAIGKPLVVVCGVELASSEIWPWWLDPRLRVDVSRSGLGGCCFGDSAQLVTAESAEAVSDSPVAGVCESGDGWVQDTISGDDN